LCVQGLPPGSAERQPWEPAASLAVGFEAEQCQLGFESKC